MGSGCQTSFDNKFYSDNHESKKTDFIYEVSLFFFYERCELPILSGVSHK